MSGVYISWPFCAQKCTYCNFASGVFKAEEQLRYADAILAEIQSHTWRWRPDTVYFGGGTPSLMPLADLERVLRAIPGAPWIEVTMEAAPGSLNPEAVRAWKSMGVNRVSLGVQSFSDKELRQTGRRHNAAVVEADCAILREAGISNINIDLISGLPHQTPESWETSLRWIERLAPPHVSVYMLEVDEDSRLGLEIIGEGGRYGARSVPDDDTIAGNYLRAVSRLSELGISRYEISNFAQPGRESVHNRKYWLVEPYVGFGVEAHSMDNGVRWGNTDSLPDYLKAISSGARPVLSERPTLPVEERYMLGLRLDEGVEVREGDTPLAVLQLLQDRMERGFLESSNGRIRLTSLGVMFSNDVFGDFLGADERV